MHTNALVRLGRGLGEGALPPYYPHTLDDVRRYAETLDADRLLRLAETALEEALDALPPGPAPARCALDLALHDHWARSLGLPLFRLWGLHPGRSPASSFTLAIPENDDAFREQLLALDGFPVLKLKLGTGDVIRDEALVRLARNQTTARLCVDANGAWTVDEAARVIPRLAAYDLLFVEEPLARRDAEAWKTLRRRLPADAPPLFADESVQTAEDLLALGEVIDGVNVKLAKSAGLRGARRLITLARALGLQVLLGCMIESAVAVTAAAHLAPLADYADLDAPLLVADDPFTGVTLERGRLLLPDRPGLGVQRAR